MGRLRQASPESEGGNLKRVAVAQSVYPCAECTPLERTAPPPSRPYLLLLPTFPPLTRIPTSSPASFLIFIPSPHSHPQIPPLHFHLLMPPPHPSSSLSNPLQYPHPHFPPVRNLNWMANLRRPEIRTHGTKTQSLFCDCNNPTG